MLKKTGIFFALVLLVVLTGSFRADDKVVKGKFVSESGRFSVKFPGTPVRTEQNVPTEVGDITVVMFMQEFSTSKVYIVGYSDYPADLIKQSDAKAMLAGAQGGVTGNLKATVTTEKYSKFGKYDALDFSAKSESYYLKYKLVLAGNRLYQLGILQDTEISKADDKAFIGTFKITK